jgi:hypothetical protein
LARLIVPVQIFVEWLCTGALSRPDDYASYWSGSMPEGAELED